MRLEGKFEGQIEFERIEVREIYPRKVTQNNQTSGKVSLPSDLIGKEILVIVPKHMKK